MKKILGGVAVLASLFAFVIAAVAVIGAVDSHAARARGQPLCEYVNETMAYDRYGNWVPCYSGWVAVRGSGRYNGRGYWPEPVEHVLVWAHNLWRDNGNQGG